MKAIVMTRHGGPEVLRISEVPLPEPKEHEIRVRIRTIGINFAEVLSRRGVYGWAPKLPYIPGMEAYGEIDAIGSSISGRSIGEAVIVGTQYGTYAESICVPAERAFPALPWFSPEESAAFAVNYLTAWIGLFEMARLRASDTLLVTSAAGGVGSAAVQLGAAFGARVVGAAGKGKQETVRRLGAAAALDYSDARWENELAEFTEHRGVNVALEMAGGAVYRATVRSLAPMGRIVLAGASAAFPRSRNPLARLATLRNVPWPNILDMVRRSYGVMCFHVGWLLDAGLVASAFADLTRFTEQHAIRPLVGECFDFAEMAAAHRFLEERRSVGKVVVRVG